ncbi:MIP/aquaporin family protein [Larsenimonas rhizosphaerae]|uniref:Aquaporin family protein n=1 Tax=Larsenimonas rhizosphaerae TaxID=2944682 RepID=A0AA42CTK3_9GAMM|nr:MIP/aquaporin family protein [Larsenimonas rhizosphaerae]MCM2130441.1 aquaporin family protein [Larsenimonas rhizosphaerae]MCX2523146.1 aquaporin family protein [Larsenimonas rhizosphaerae]
MHAFIGEFFGSMTLILFGDGVVANVLLQRSKGKDGGWMVIATGWGLAVMVAVFVANAMGSPGADINPAVTVAKWVMGMYTDPAVVGGFILAQIAGCFAGGVLVWLMYLPHWKVTDDPGLKQAVFCTAPAINHPVGNIISEVIGTIALIVGIGAIVSAGDIAGGMLPFLVGGLVWAIGLSLGGPTGYAINPARDLGPRLAHAILPIAGKGASGWGYAWVPIVGPVLGACIGAYMWMQLM